MEGPEGNFSGSMKCTFQRGKAGHRPLPCQGEGGDGDAHLIYLGLKFGQILFFLGVENWRFFRLRKSMATGALLHPRFQCNFQKLLHCHVRKICNPVHGMRAKFADR